MEKEQFYIDSKKFFDDRLFYEIYSTDKFTICNLSNQCYGLFFYKNTQYGQSGILLTRDQVKKVAKDIRYLSLAAAFSDSKKFNDRIFFLNEYTYNSFKTLKMKTDREGPTSEIDYEMEQELINKMNKKFGGR